MFLSDFSPHLHISRKAKEDVILSCLSDGIPMPMIAWYKDDQVGKTDVFLKFLFPNACQMRSIDDINL